MGESCCLCIPLDIGVKLLAITTILSTMALGWITYLNREEFLDVFLPFAVLGGIMSAIWLYTLTNPNESSKKFAFFGYLLLVLVFETLQYGWVFYNGRLLDWMCSPEAIDEMNTRGYELQQEGYIEGGPPMTEEKCMYGGKEGIMFDFTAKVVFNVYFTYVIMKWTKLDDDYQK